MQAAKMKMIVALAISIVILLASPETTHSFSPTWATLVTKSDNGRPSNIIHLDASLAHAESSESAEMPLTSDASSLPSLFPMFDDILQENGFTIPTPIQEASSLLSKGGEDLLLIAATGSGKSLAYLLPSLSRAYESPDQKKTVLIVAPTRELAAQLARDTSLLIPDDTEEDQARSDDTTNVVLAVRGIPPPTPSQIDNARVLVGTPHELFVVLTRISGAQKFIAGDSLSSLVLDEIDVLLPPTPKALRTNLDGSAAQRERKSQEKKRKLRAAQRRGVEFIGGSGLKGDSIDLSDAMNSQVLTPTERVLRLVASARYAGDTDGASLQILAGSATASRTTLDRLNKAIRWAANEGGVIGGMEGVWKGRMKVCRPVESGGSSATGTEEAHTIRAVTVPSVVDHRYVAMTKSSLTNSEELLQNVAEIISRKQPRTALVFICGEFSRSIKSDKAKNAPKIARGGTSQSRRDAKRRMVYVEKQRSKASANKSNGPEPLSVRRACSILQSRGVDAQPMHVVLGLQEDSQDDNDDSPEVELPQCLVTFEGTARGLHFDNVDYVFVVGRPTSAASYLHLAGRVGRATGDAVGPGQQVEIRPGTVVSFCSKGRLGELEKWTNQVGALGLREVS
mmetsp:Transcript_10237/g.23958  ORF Transcript_10237/g.23958 Transcript_10237/m.23958 type:complete len:624 (+) Transcript_10237:111-1982(+)